MPPTFHRVRVGRFPTAADKAAVVYVGRAGWGWARHPLCNRPLQEFDGDRTTCLAAYRAAILARPDLSERLAELRVATRAGALPLGCWCHLHEDCHADILIELLLRLPPTDDVLRARA